MALSLSEKFRMGAGGRKFMMFEVTADGSTVSIDAGDVDLDQIEFAMISPPENLVGSLSITASDLATNTGSTLTSIPVTGAAFGDPVIVGTDIDPVNLILCGHVAKAGEVAIVVQNETTGTLSIPAGYEVTVIKNVGLKTYTGDNIVFGPALTSGDKFNLMLIGW